MMPAWHDKPTEPGLWLLINNVRFLFEIADILSLNRCHIELGDRYYGPIPPDNASGVGECL